MKALRLPDVVEKTGISKTRLYVLERQGRFPNRIELGPNSVGWLESEVDEWIAARCRRSPGRENLTQAASPEV